VTVAVCDSGPLFALANARDPDHKRVVEFIRGTRHAVVVPTLCVGEVTFLLARDFGPEAERCSGIMRSWSHAAIGAGLARMAELVRMYGDFPLGAVDASVVALAEELGTPFVATLDHRHFRAIRPRHVESFTLLP